MSYVEIPPRYFTAPGSGIDLAMLRRPRAVAAMRKRVFSLPPTSRIRQRLLGRLFAVALEAYERGDFSTAPARFFAEDCELRSPVAGRVDLPAVAIGRAEITRWLETWHEPFKDVSYRPREFFDGGDVGYFAFEMTAVGRGSGIETQGSWYSAFWFSDGFVSRQYMSVIREDALREAGFA